MFRDLIEDLNNYSPDPNQFLDVPFVPSDDAVIDAMLILGDVGRNDLLYDLGSGDGRIVVAAARDRGARAIGIEIDTVRIADAMEYAGDSRVEHMVDFIENNIFSAEVGDATVVTLYLLESVNIQLRPRLLSELRPGTRIVSHAFDMGDWKADELLELGGVKIYKWIVPAQLAGTWEWNGWDGTAYRVELEQKYQEVSGSAWIGDQEAQLERAELCGGTLTLEMRVDDTQPVTRFTVEFKDNELDAVWDES